MVVQDVGEYFVILALTIHSLVVFLESRRPNNLQFLIIYALLMLLLVDSRKYYCIESQFSENSRIRWRMSKWIQLPANLWSNSELAPEKLMRLLKVANHVQVVRAGLIRRNHASMHYLQLTAGDQFFDLILVWSGKVLIVAFRERDITHCVGVRGFRAKLLDDAIKNMPDRVYIVLIVCPEPSCVHVRMWHKMHFNWTTLRSQYSLELEAQYQHRKYCKTFHLYSHKNIEL